MPIRWDKFTVKAQEAVQRANELASEHGNPELQPVHLLAALVEDKEGIVPPVLEKIGIGPQSVLDWVYAVGFAPWAGDKAGSLLYAFAYMLCCWAVAYAMDRKRIYIKL